MGSGPSLENATRLEPSQTKKVSQHADYKIRVTVLEGMDNSSATGTGASTKAGDISEDAVENIVMETRITVFSTKQYVRDFLEARLTAQFPNTTFTESTLDEETASLASGSEVVIMFVNDECNKQVVRLLAECGVKLIALRCAGYDRVDLAACAEYGIKVTSVPIYSPQSVAEHAVALAFALNRKVHLAYARVLQGNYALSGLVGKELTGKTVGVIGTGAIGQHACRIFKGIGMRVLAYDHHPKPACAHLCEYMSLEGMLPMCDIVSLHCPLMPETHHLMNHERISSMKPGAILINVSRGGLVDSDALFEALESGQMGGLGLDVYENEGDLFFEDYTMYDNKTIMQHWDRRFRTLISYPQVLVTPHSAFLTVEALDNIATTTLQNITQYASGEKLANEVVPKHH